MHAMTFLFSFYIYTVSFYIFSSFFFLQKTIPASSEAPELPPGHQHRLPGLRSWVSEWKSGARLCLLPPPQGVWSPVQPSGCPPGAPWEPGPVLIGWMALLEEAGGWRWVFHALMAAVGDLTCLQLGWRSVAASRSETRLHSFPHGSTCLRAIPTPAEVDVSVVVFHFLILCDKRFSSSCCRVTAT